jgi:Arc/MetJ-type ribon-helix-helix transcriptional regulator
MHKFQSKWKSALNMKNPIRITVALDDETNDLIENLTSKAGVSKSELMRQAVRFYNENRSLTDNVVRKKLNSYMELLLSGEHIILDVDHWLLFLNLVESSPEKEHFWEKCKEVARSHAEQLRSKVRSPEDLFDRLEACNFFRMTKNSQKDFTLVLTSETAKKFIRVFVEEFLSSMGLKAELKENVAKIRVVIKA